VKQPMKHMKALSNQKPVTAQDVGLLSLKNVIDIVLPGPNTTLSNTQVLWIANLVDQNLQP